MAYPKANHYQFEQQQQEQINTLVNEKQKGAPNNQVKELNQAQLYRRKIGQNAISLELKILITAIFLTVVLISFYIATALSRKDLSKKLFNINSKTNMQNNGYLMMNNQKVQQQGNQNTVITKTVRDGLNAQQIRLIKQNAQWHPTPPPVTLYNQPFSVQNNNQHVVQATRILPQQKQAAKSYKQLKNLPRDDPLAATQISYYQEKYQINSFTEEIPFCVVIPSYNNAKDNRVQNNFKSIQQQNYSNYRVYFINDGSTDNTAQIAQKYLDMNLDFKSKVTLKNNQIQQFALPNIISAARQFCKPWQIFLIVDGDDQIIGRQVFKLFNSQFQATKAYFIYSNFLNSRGSIGYSRPFRQDVIVNNNYRKAPLLSSHLRAFYTQLLLLIDDKDLRNRNGQYFHAANDVAICLPILQMSHSKIQYLPQLTYLYNSATGLNNHATKLKQQKQNDRQIRAKNRYSQIQIDFQALKKNGHDYETKIQTKAQQNKPSQIAQVLKNDQNNKMDGGSGQVQKQKQAQIQEKYKEASQDVAHIDQLNRQNMDNAGDLNHEN